MYNQGCCFVNYLTVGTAKRCLLGRLSYHIHPVVFRLSTARGMTRRTLCSISRHPMSMKTENEDKETSRALELDIEEYLSNLSDDVPNPLSYVNLKKAGRIDLVSRIMDAGGYIEVSKRLGVSVDEEQFVPPAKVSEVGRFEPFSEPEDQGASIAIGRSLEERMEFVHEFAKQGDSSEFITQRSNLRRIDSVPSAAELIEQNARIAPRVVDEPSVEGENLSLTIPMRLGLLSLTIITAIGFGKASSGVVSPDVISASKSIASGLTLAHSLLALYCALLVAPRMHRSSTLWFIKVLLGGPLAVVELRSLGSSKASR